MREQLFNHNNKHLWALYVLATKYRLKMQEISENQQFHTHHFISYTSILDGFYIIKNPVNSVVEMYYQNKAQCKSIDQNVILREILQINKFLK